MRQEGHEEGRRSAVVVGAGLTGATIAWLSAARGDDVVLVSNERPASQATALAPGIVHGIGPPGGIGEWVRLPKPLQERAGRRARLGYDLVRDLVLVSRRPTCFQRRRHALVAPPGLGSAELEDAARVLRAIGHPVHVAEHRGSPALVRQADALIDPRRLTFELLRRARDLGARLHLATPCVGVERALDERTVIVRTSAGALRAERLFWAGGRPVPGGPARADLRVRIVLHQLLRPGAEPLDEMLEAGEGDLLMAPDPAREGRTILARIAEETAAGGLHWPDPPPAWNVHRGPAIRQRLAEAVVGPPCPTFDDASTVVSMVGFAGWPIALLMGTCAEALEGGK